MPQHGDDSLTGSTRLLDEDESPPFDVRNSGASSPLLLLGDHAGVAIPRRLGTLGLSGEARGRHIACDIGVAALGAALADRLGATFIAQRWSRLVIDCNRDPGRADSVCEVSDGVRVPGNAGLSAAGRAARTAEVFEPYHDRIAAEIDARGAAGQPTILICLHSFTPAMGGHARPWRFGVLHEGGSPYSQTMLRDLRASLGDAAVGDNEPYRMDDTDYTVARHALARGLDYLELEVRQDQISAAAGVTAVCDQLAPLLERAVLG